MMYAKEITTRLSKPDREGQGTGVGFRTDGRQAGSRKVQRHDVVFDLRNGSL